MLYGNNSNNSSSPRHAGVGADDPFNKKKLAEEAKKDQERIKEAQKQREKNDLQIKINNLERDLSRQTIDLRTKENLFFDSKRKLDDLNRAIFLLEGNIKKQEGGVGYLNDQLSSQEYKTNISESELEKIKTNLSSAQREKNTLESEYNRDTAVVNELEAKISRLKSELDKIITEDDMAKKELAKVEAKIRNKKSETEKLNQTLRSVEIGSGQLVGEKARVAKAVQSEQVEIKKEKEDLLFKKRVVEQLERSNETFTQELAKLKRDKEQKEREITDLKRKKEEIK
jgi:chromosome segregation protein